VVGIRDPLSLAKLGSQGPVQLLLEEATDAWARANKDDALHYCRAAKHCAEHANDIPGTALAQLYLADAYARIGELARGVDQGKRAAKIFGMRGCSHNAMVACLLVARLESSLQRLDHARQSYQDALDLCERLQDRERIDARSKAVFYGQIASEIRSAMTDVATMIAKQYDQMCRLLDSIPILRLSEAPGRSVFERSNVVGYVATGEFLVDGRAYYLYPLRVASKSSLELKAGAVHFALPVPENGWLDDASEKGDYALVQRETQVTREGPGVLWTGEDWVGGRFERDADTGDIRFVSSRSRIIGQEKGYAIALLKPVG